MTTYKKPQCIMTWHGKDMYVYSIKFIGSDTFKAMIDR